jgi:trimeric autotransporter adhesin
MHTIKKLVGSSLLLGVAVGISACGASPEDWSGTADPAGSGSPEETAVSEVQQAVNSASWNTLGNTLTGTAGNAKLGAINTTSAEGPYGLELWVKATGTSATRALLIQPVSSAAPYNVPSLVGGFSGNLVTAGVTGATIAGGGASTFVNRVTDHWGAIGGGDGNQVGNNDANVNNANDATVGGGAGNTASAAAATVGGGAFNTASGNRSFVGGGQDNLAFGSHATVAAGSANAAFGDNSTVSGGSGHDASGHGSTIAGGIENIADGDASIAVGGTQNSAAGDNSLAAGQKASANFDGCFVWADMSTSTTQDCGAANRFVARATGGVFFYSNNTNPRTGVTLTPGAGSWTNLSDRDAKTDIVPIVPRDVLRRVTSIPMATWTYKSEPGVRHMGPMAQDFRAAFGLGTDDRSIVTIDADGVALAAIQGLNEKATELEVTVAKLVSENRELRDRLDRLEASRPRAHASMFSGSALGFGVIALGLAGAFVGARRRKRG